MRGRLRGSSRGSVVVGAGGRGLWCEEVDGRRKEVDVEGLK